MNWKIRYEEIKKGEWVVVKTYKGYTLRDVHMENTLPNGACVLHVDRIRQKGYGIQDIYVLWIKPNRGGDYFIKEDIIRKATQEEILMIKEKIE